MRMLRVDNPVFRHHSPLVLAWSDEQLWPVAAQLAPHLPEDLTPAMMLAVAAVARSVVIEEKLTGKGVYYSRRRDDYTTPVRYRGGDPRHTYHYVIGAVDILRAAGLIDHEKGIHAFWGEGRRSTCWATGELVGLLASVLDTTESRGIVADTEVIVLRGRGDYDKRALPYEDTPDTVAMRQQVEALNEALAQIDLRQYGKRMPIPVGRRIFNGDFTRGGRFYCHGASYQNIRSRARRDLQIVVGGQPRPVVEIDYGRLHPTMAYAKAGHKAPNGDLYRIPGYERSLIKLGVNIMFNATTRHGAKLAIATAIHDKTALREASGLPRRWSRFGYSSFTEDLVTAIENHHHKIRQFFNSDCGARFQRVDSDMAVEVMEEMIAATGRCPLPVHDSFLVADTDEDALRQVMDRVARRRGLTLKLEVHRQTQTTIEELLQQRSPLIGATTQVTHQTPHPNPVAHQHAATQPNPHPTQSHHRHHHPLHMGETGYELLLLADGFPSGKTLETGEKACAPDDREGNNNDPRPGKEQSLVKRNRRISARDPPSLRRDPRRGASRNNGDRGLAEVDSSPVVNRPRRAPADHARPPPPQSAVQSDN